MKKQERQILQRIIRKTLTLATPEKTSARTLGILATILTIPSANRITAYYIWLTTGGGLGSDLDHWLQAGKEIMARSSAASETL
jgi:hypothetical protein